MPRILSCDFCIGNPGSMKRTLSLPLMRCVQAMNEANEAATPPVVGMQARGVMSRSRKALTKRDACSLSSATPAAAGYCDTMPLSRAAFSASMPMRFGGSPGEPWSIRMNGMPVFSSSAEATSSTSPMVAFSRSAMLSRATISSTSSFAKTLLSAAMRFISMTRSPLAAKILRMLSRSCSGERMPMIPAAAPSSTTLADCGIALARVIPSRSRAITRSRPARAARTLSSG